MTEQKPALLWTNRKPSPEMLWLGIILLVAGILRFWQYSSFSLSNDELSAISRLRFNTFGELVKGGFYVDGHPGGIQVFLWYWSKWFGSSVASLRFPFILFGILTILFSYLVAKKMFGVVAGLFTAASLSFLEFSLLFSQIARPYGSGIFFCLLMVFFWLRVVFDQDKVQAKSRVKVLNLTGYIIATALCMYNHYFSFLLALIVGISGFFFLRKNQFFTYILSGLIAVLLFQPHMNITLNHLSFKGVGLWLGKPGPFWGAEHINFIFNNSLFMAGVFAVASVLLTWKGKLNAKLPGAPWLLISWFLLPMVIGYIYSLFVNPVLQNSVLFFSFPFLIMLIFFASGSEFGKFQQVLLALFLLSGIFGTLVIDNYYNKQHFGEFKGIARATQVWESKYNPDSITKVVVVNSPYYLDYYFEQAGYSTKFELYDIRNEKDILLLARLVKDSKKPFFLYAWTKPAPEGIEDVIRSKFPYIEKSMHYGLLSGITLFTKQKGTEFDQGLELSELCRETSNFDTVNDGQAPTGITQKSFFSHPNALSLDSANEFGSGFRKDLDSFKNEKTLMIVAKTKVNPESVPGDALFVVSVETNEGKAIQWESSAIDRFSIPGSWNYVFHSMYIQGKDCKGAVLKIYIWNKGRKNLLVDDLEYVIYRVGRHSPFEKDQFRWGSE
jgi:hypothetical protein